jgi:transposase-like protein
MEERLRFVARLLEGEAMTDVCREFEISRKTMRFKPTQSSNPAFICPE